MSYKTRIDFKNMGIMDQKYAELIQLNINLIYALNGILKRARIALKVSKDLQS